MNQVFPYEYNFEGYFLVLTELWGKAPPKSIRLDNPIYVCCDAVEASYISQGPDNPPLIERVLRPLVTSSSKKWESAEHLSIPLKQTQIKNLRLYLVDSHGAPVSGSKWLIHCMIELHPLKS